MSMETDQIQRTLLDKYGLRVTPEMGRVHSGNAQVIERQ